VSALVATVLLTLSFTTPVAAGDELIVRRGDTLWDLAQRHRVTVTDLVAWNRIENPSLIRVGQRIVLEPPAPVVAPAPPPAPASAPLVHVARGGDTLWDIAIRYGTTVDAIVVANRLNDPSFIRVGQAITIPTSASAPSPVPATPPSTSAAPPETVVHVVAGGETLWVISARYGVTIGAIVAANDLADPSFIRTGQRLAIPTTAGAAPAAASAPPRTSGMPPAMATAVTARSGWRDVLVAAAREFGLPPAFVLAVAWHESGWQPAVVSFAGAVGLMQLMPATATWVADTMLHEPAAIGDPRWNARAGARLLAFYLDRYGGDKPRTLAAYFQGMASVEQSGIRASSQPYIDSILALEALFSR
jgi:LysM repeat protein